MVIRHPETPCPNPLPETPVGNNPADLPHDFWGAKAALALRHGTHQHHGVVSLPQLCHRDVPPHGDISVVGTAFRARRLREGVDHILPRSNKRRGVMSKPQPGPRPAADRRSSFLSPAALRRFSPSLSQLF